MGNDNKQEVPKSEAQDGLKAIVVSEKKETKKDPKMIPIAIDGFGNRIFVSEKKVAEKKQKLGIK